MAMIVDGGFEKANESIVGPTYSAYSAKIEIHPLPFCLLAALARSDADGIKDMKSQGEHAFW
jgi:hypothetical protein